jgi:hypothetical protein
VKGHHWRSLTTLAIRSPTRPEPGRIRLAALLLAGATYAAFTVAAARPAVAAGNIVTIRNPDSRLCLEVPLGGESYNGAVVQQNKCSLRPVPRQLWLRIPAPRSGYWYLINQANSKCMDVRDGRNADRAPIHLWDCTSTDGMYWRFAVDTLSTVRSPIGGRCLDVASTRPTGYIPDFLLPPTSTEPGAKLQTDRCTEGNAAQLFTLADER